MQNCQANTSKRRIQGLQVENIAKTLKPLVKFINIRPRMTEVLELAAAKQFMFSTEIDNLRKKVMLSLYFEIFRILVKFVEFIYSSLVLFITVIVINKLCSFS